MKSDPVDMPRTGLGCGGPSGLGTRTHGDRDKAVALVQRALELGIRLFDAAELYRTEDILGEGIRGAERESLFLCSKFLPRTESTAADLRRSLEASLSRIGTDYLDLFYLHAVVPEEYDTIVAALYPELQRLRSEGLIRRNGITERFITDPGHRMLVRALPEERWEVAMVGFNILNQSARERVFPLAARHGVRTVGMFAARLALSRAERLREVASDLRSSGHDIPVEDIAEQVQAPDSPSLPDTAYRFCRYEEGLDTMLIGTGNVAHLEENLRSLSAPPLPSAHAARLRKLFAGVDSVSGQ